MSQPVLFAVDEDQRLLRDIERELVDRYSRSYRIVCACSAEEALAELEALREAGADVALVLAAQGCGGMRGVELLGRVRDLHGHAQRGLMIEWGSWGQAGTAEEIFEAMARRQIEYYVVRPSQTPDELFHQSVSTFLLEWANARRVSPHTVHIVSESWTGRAQELKEVLGRCAIPHSFLLADSADGRAKVAEADGAEPLPLVILPSGEVLANPTNLELATAAGATIDPERREFDVVIVGGGPAGLSAAVYGASEGLQTLVLDDGGIGGQATSSSLIRNYLGFPRGVSGRRLAENAYEQAWVFGAKFAFMHDATGLRREGERICIELSSGGEVSARAVILATGATYRRLGVAEIEELVGAGVFYGGPASEAATTVDEEVHVVGGANSAGQAALHLAEYARKVTLVVRAGSLDQGMSHYLVRQVEATPNVEVRLGTEVVGGEAGEDGWLRSLDLRGVGGETETVPSEGLFLLIGAHPNTDWLPAEIVRDEGGFICTGAAAQAVGAWPLERDPLGLETAMPGVFAAGDVRHGSMSRVASAVGEGSIAIRLVHDLLATDQLGDGAASPVEA
ncbi:MAG TPA: FAD-dependent oxidoreductase [Solirubrobacterales bacterium]|nr:FAD-dependent oxidoreductase [Solirubrobacterales bacterium]